MFPLEGNEAIIVRTGSDQALGTREKQEDSVGLSDFLNFRFCAHGGMLGVIADGMGGFDAGEEASRTAVEIFLDAYAAKNTSEPIRDALMRSLFSANDAILGIAARLDSNARVGTTLLAAVVFKSQLHWISVGDTRLYLIREGKMTQLSVDHNVATELKRKVSQRLMTEEEAQANPDRKVLTSYVGTGDLSDIDCNIRPYKVKPDDILVLCTDGLYQSLTEDEIMDNIGGHPQEAASALIRAATEKEIAQQDNLSVIVFRCDKEMISAQRYEEDLEAEISGFTATNRALGFILVGIAIVGLLWIFFHFRH